MKPLESWPAPWLKERFVLRTRFRAAARGRSKGGLVRVNSPLGLECSRENLWSSTGREAKCPGILQMGDETQWDETEAWGATVQLHTVWSSLERQPRDPASFESRHEH